MIEPREFELLERCVDGTLADDEIETLHELLQNNPEARAKLRSLATVDLGLQDLAIGVANDFEQVEPSSGTSGGQRQFGSYALVVVATVLLVVGVQQAFSVVWRAQPSTRQESPVYVATVGPLSQCRWRDEKYQEGDRLAAGVIELEAGVAEIWFDDGGRLILQEDTKCQIVSHNAACVLDGKVVFRNTTDETFDLRTPNSVLVDLGTEYAVAVNADVEEVHVFEGEVWRTAVDDEEQVDFIIAGEARRYRSQTVDAVDLSDEFIRHVSMQDAIPRTQDIIASESFEYSEASILTSGEANGGLGWNEAWRGEMRTLDKQPVPDRALAVEQTLDFGDLVGRGGSLVVSGNVSIYRQLATPIRMDQDGTYFFRVLLRDETGGADTTETLFLNFRQSESLATTGGARFVNGLRPNKGLFARLQGTSRTRGVIDQTPLSMLVGKIVARKDQPDQAFLHVVSDQDSTEHEPIRWHLRHQAKSNDTFDLLAIHGISKKLRVDELVVGRTWASVARPQPALSITPLPEDSVCRVGIQGMGRQSQ